MATARAVAAGGRSRLGRRGRGWRRLGTANTAPQIGAALGLAVLTTVSTAAAETRLPTERRREGVTAGDQRLVDAAREKLTHGYTTALLVGVGLLLAAAIIGAAAVNTTRTHAAAPSDRRRAGGCQT